MAGIRRFSKNSILPIQIERYDVTDHPAIKSGDKLSHTVRISLNNQEVQYFQGLANIFNGVTKQAAVRVAVHNLAGKDLSSQRPKGKTDGKRSTVFKLALSASLYERLKWSAAAYSETIGDHIRRIVWHLSQGIKSGQITRVAGAKRKTTKDKLKDSATKSRANPGSKLTALKTAGAQAYEEGIERKKADYEELGLFVDSLRDTGTLAVILNEEGRVCMDAAKSLMIGEINHIEELETQKIVEQEKTEAIKALAKRTARWCDDLESNWMFYLEEAEEQWEDKRPLTEEELEDLEEFNTELQSYWDTQGTPD